MTEKEFLSKPHMAYDNFLLPHSAEDHKQAVERFHQVCNDAMIEAKMDRAVELMERIAARRNAPIPDAENAGPGVQELWAKYQPSASDQARICAESEAAYAARNPHKKTVTRDDDPSGYPSKAALTTMEQIAKLQKKLNDLRAEGKGQMPAAMTLLEQIDGLRKKLKDIRAKEKPQTPFDKTAEKIKAILSDSSLTLDQRISAVDMESRCQQSEAAYAARNPHKREAAQ